MAEAKMPKDAGEVTPVRENLAITERPDRLHDEGGGPVAERADEDTRSPEQREADRIRALRMTEELGMPFVTAERLIREGKAPKEAETAREDEGTVTLRVSKATARELLPTLTAAATDMESRAAIGLASQRERDRTVDVASDYREAVGTINKALED